jgi:ELWxxDGT repeat protein
LKLALLGTLLAILSSPTIQGQTASLVKDIDVRDEPRYQPGPVWGLQALGESAIFQMKGDAAWVTDGSEGGTRILTELCPGECERVLQIVGKTRNLLFWVASAGSGQGDRLWRSDGTRPGTFPLAGHRFFFVEPNEGELWVTDGTPAGTRMLQHLRYLRQWLTATSNGIYYVADNGQGEEIWKSDGTAQGTRRLTNFENPEPFSDDLNNHRGWAFELGGTLVFAADDGHTGFRLWRSSGSPQTTVPVSQAGSSYELAQVGEKVIFLRSGQSACEAWSIGATGEAERLIERLDCAWNYPLVTAGNRVYIVESPNTDYTVWRTDGTPAGTDRLASVGQGLDYVYFSYIAVSASGRKVFIPSGNGVWVWSESEGLRHVQAAGGPLTISSSPGNYVSFNGRFLFSACDGTA